MSAPSNPKWLTAGESVALGKTPGPENIWHLKLDRGVFAVVFDGKSEKGAQRWFKSSLSGFDSWLKPWKGAVLKLLGAGEALKTAQALSSQLGFSNTKTQEVPPNGEIFVYGNSGKIRFAAEGQATSVSPKSESKDSGGRTRVLIVDDSKTICDLLTKIFSRDPSLEVVGAVNRPTEVEAKVRELKPHVITMDIHMPEMTGVELVRQLLPRFPIPTVMISSVSLQDGEHVLKALEYGAVDYIQKPSLAELESAIPVILEKVKQARYIKVKAKREILEAAPAVVVNSTLADETLGRYLIAIGSSTGGTEALRKLFLGFPAKIPPVVVVQHIPAVFSTAFARSLNDMLPYEVKEAQDGDEVLPNRILIAPGGLQMSMVPGTNGFKVKVFDGAPVNRHKPSVDVLFDSVAALHAKKSIGVILTGMGADGAKGLLKMRTAGSHTLGQDEATSVVYGMPKAAFELGAVGEVAPLPKLADRIFRALEKVASGKKAA